MDDIYYLKIEVEIAEQIRLIDSILGVSHDVEEPLAWILSMEYDATFGDLPIYYISNFIHILEDKFETLERIGIQRDMISIWRFVNSPGEVFMEYWPEELNLMASAGIHFRIVCRADAEQPDVRSISFQC